MNYRITQTPAFRKWLVKLADHRARARIAARIRMITVDGNFGDHKRLGGGLSELRIFYGPGYRIYYTIQQQVVVILLSGGDKSTQHSDIAKAKTLLNDLEI